EVRGHVGSEGTRTKPTDPGSRAHATPGRTGGVQDYGDAKVAPPRRRRTRASQGVAPHRAAMPCPVQPATSSAVIATTRRRRRPGCTERSRRASRSWPFSPDRPASWWRGQDLNLRPSGYESDDQRLNPYQPVPDSASEQGLLEYGIPTCTYLYHGTAARGVEKGVERSAPATSHTVPEEGAPGLGLPFAHRPHRACRVGAR